MIIYIYYPNLDGFLPSKPGMHPCLEMLREGFSVVIANPAPQPTKRGLVYCDIRT